MLRRWDGHLVLVKLKHPRRRRKHDTKGKTPLKTDSHPEGRDYWLRKKRNGLNSQSFIDCAAKPTKAKAITI
jgi:hypothetical protein